MAESTDAFESSAGPDDWRARWKSEDAWTVREFAQLCCGWNPSVHEFPNRDLYNEVLEKINRAVRVGALPTIDKLGWPPTEAERMYDSVPAFRPLETIAWAARRYPLFLYSASDQSDPPRVTSVKELAPAGVLYRSRTSRRDSPRCSRS